jgi:hypothetical protein
MIKLLSCLFLLVFLSACIGSSVPEKASTQIPAPVANEDAGKGMVEMATRTGSKYFVTENHPRGASLSDITVHASTSADTIKLQDADPITSMLVNDLDQDGYDELYIVTTSAGSGSLGNVIAVRMGKDQRLSKINFTASYLDDKRLQGHMGKDRYSIDSVNHLLLRTFPVYKEGDPNANPTGGERTISYRLTKTGETLELVPVE